MGICLGLQASVGIWRALQGSAGVCGGLRGSIWPHTLRHSETLLWGPPGSPVLRPLAPGKILSRTGRTTNRSPSWSYPQDGRTALLRTLEGSNFHERYIANIPNFFKVLVMLWEFSTTRHRSSFTHTSSRSQVAYESVLRPF